MYGFVERPACVSLSIDGWSHINKVPVVGVSLLYQGMNYMNDAVDDNGEPQTGEFLGGWPVVQ